LVSNYTKDANRLQQQLSEIIAAPSRFLEVEKLKTQKQLLVSKIALNKQRLEQKLKEASQSVVLESIGTVVQSIEGLIKDANSQVLDHNSIAANLDTERATLTSQVWRLVLDELKTELVEFEAARDDLNKAIAAITTKLATTKAEKVKKTDEIRELERQTTSVQPTIDEINKLLESFGFQGFELAKAASGTSYELVRPDGTDAKETLSEGEKTFVSFLYFYHLLKGSESDSGVTNDRIVVFDDPVSSLDSDILFIIGSLIKGLCDEVRAGTGHIKQVFVLTHNIYFHKELTFSSKRRGMARNEETFWIVRKPGLFSTITKYPTNPIKTSYELLWAEVRNPDRSNLGIQNTLRRILDTYFKILGGMDFEALCAFFEGKDKLICKSLCSWMHDGSHYAHDDLYMSIDDSMVANYLRVFRAIFEMTNHIAHYEMMMGDAPVKAGLTAREGKTVPAAVPIATA
jgi:wobble nucleotide-excising tRNase